VPYTRDQIILFNIALKMQLGDTKYSYSDAAAKIARTTPQSELRKMIAEGEKKKK